MDERIKALSDYRLEKAQKNLEISKKLLKDGYADYAVLLWVNSGSPVETYARLLLY